MPDLQEEVRRLGPWFHNLHLPDGTETAPEHPLGDFPRRNWEAFALRIPRDISGWRVLDIGCNAGYYSFRLARWGAEVTGIDIDERYLRQARWAAEVYGLEDLVRFEKRQVYDLIDDEPYDMVLFLGVFYHLRYPLLALDIVREVTKRVLVFQSLTTPSRATRTETDGLTFDRLAELDEEGWPRFAFVEGAFAGDPTNWFVPNRPAVHAALRSAGFVVTDAGGEPFLVCAPSKEPSAHQAWNRSEFLAATQRPWHGHEASKVVPRDGTLEQPRRV
jgi:tRNA (mo5U34)-methyltransferase